MLLPISRLMIAASSSRRSVCSSATRLISAARSATVLVRPHDSVRRVGGLDRGGHLLVGVGRKAANQLPGGRVGHGVLRHVDGPFDGHCLPPSAKVMSIIIASRTTLEATWGALEAFSRSGAVVRSGPAWRAQRGCSNRVRAVRAP